MMTTWADVREGDELRGRDEAAWVVTSASTGEVTLERHGREPFTFRPDPTGQVELITPSLHRLAVPEQADDVAIATVGLHLGGVVVAHQERSDGPWIVQASGWTLPDLHFHLSAFHGAPVADRPVTLPDLERWHLRLHDAGDVSTGHIHSDAPFRQDGLHRVGS